MRPAALGLLVAIRLGAAPQDPAEAALRAGDPVAARRAAEAAVRTQPDHAASHTALGAALWMQRERGVALRSWVKARDLGGDPRVLELLRSAAPRLADGAHLVASVDEFLALAELHADFRRQQEVETALARFTTQKGIALPMSERSSAECLVALHRMGYLDRPGGPPSGRGTYLSDAQGRVRSSVFGSWRERPTGPAALANPKGYVLLPETIAAGLATDRGDALEFGLAQLDDEALAAQLRAVGRSAYRVTDAWAWDVFLARIDDYSRGEGRNLGALRPALTRIAAQGERLQRWHAAGLLRRLGVETKLEANDAEVQAILEATGAGKLPVEASRLALDGRSTEAPAILAATLSTGSREAFRAALALAAGRKERVVAEALVQGLEQASGRWVMQRDAVLAVLETIAGEALGESPAAWRAWLDRRR